MTIEFAYSIDWLKRALDLIEVTYFQIDIKILCGSQDYNFEMISSLEGRMGDQNNSYPINYKWCHTVKHILIFNQDSHSKFN